MPDLDVTHVAARLAALPGVLAVALGGSRARGAHRPDSDWDLGLYYRGEFSTTPLRALGFAGTVWEPHQWAHFMNGGAFLTIDGCKVDVLYRDLDEVEHWQAEAESGRFTIEHVPGYLVGMASYVVVGELTHAVVLHGALPQPSFPPALAETAPRRWRWERDFALTYASMHADRGDAGATAAAITAAMLCEAHARLATRSEWSLNEKGLLNAAGLTQVTAPTGRDGLRRLVEEARSQL
jgi:hypothetical protein